MKHLNLSRLPEDGVYGSELESGPVEPLMLQQTKDADGGTGPHDWDLQWIGSDYARYEHCPRDTDDAGPIRTNFPKPSGNEDYVTFNEIASAKPPGTPGGGNGGNKDDGVAGDTVLFSYVSGDPLVDNSLEYNVQVDFYGAESDWTDNLVEDFKAAADVLSLIITGDIADINFNGDLIDDIRIDASLVDIDGSGGVLGQVGPAEIRTTNSLPVTAVMKFDTADAQDFDDLGLFFQIVLHEMLHSIGFGTIWDVLGLLDTTVDDQGKVVDYRFNGARANQEFAQEFPDQFGRSGGQGIFVETDGGPGTAGVHWDKEEFDKELMTGYSDATGSFISDMTFASLEDLGYETVWEDSIA